MTLNSHANYPSTRSYVLKLHRDADLQRGQIFGRLESLASGHHFDFRSGEELLACLSQQMAPVDAVPLASHSTDEALR
jgi:hypothetical protein